MIHSVLSLSTIILQIANCITSVPWEIQVQALSPLPRTENDVREAESEIFLTFFKHSYVLYTIDANQRCVALVDSLRVSNINL